MTIPCNKRPLPAVTSDEEKSEYELIREKNMRRNAALLKSLGFDDNIPHEDTQPRIQNNKQKKKKGTVPIKKPPTRRRPPVDQTYGVSFKNRKQTNSKKKTAKVPRVPYESARSNEDRLALEGREIISYDSQTFRNRLGKVTGMFEHTQGILFTVTYDDGMTEDMTEEKLDERLNEYGKLTEIALDEYNMNDSNAILCVHLHHPQNKSPMTALLIVAWPSR